MVTPNRARPVDRLPKPDGFMFTRREALDLDVCCRCGQAPDLFNPADLADYEITAMCPTCWAEIDTEEDER